jgi:broad specificity phosphatase PhoE
MLNPLVSSPSQTADDRETRIQALLESLRPQGEQVLRQMAERLVDLPEDQAFGQIEYDLRDLAHDLAASSHQAGLQAGKKTRPANLAG